MAHRTRGALGRAVVAATVTWAAVLLLPPTPVSAAGASLVVNSPGDEPDTSPGNGACATTAGTCTLRAAIQEVNALAGGGATGPFLIEFAAQPGGATLLIQPVTPLPRLTAPATTIDGTTSNGGLDPKPGVALDTGTAFDGSSAVLDVQIDGSSIDPASYEICGGSFGQYGLCIGASGTVVRGLSITGFHPGPGRSAGGMRILADATVESTFIGVTPAGTPAGNASGISISSSATIGGPAPGATNVIAANNGPGVWFSADGAGDELVEQNIIGLLPDGVTPAGNSDSGVAVQFRDGARIQGNVLSANSSTGLKISQGANGAIVLDNRIGTTADGTAAAGNTGGGIHLADSHGGTVGGDGTAPGALAGGNVISGNGHIGITMSRSNDWSIDRNHIGVDLAGTAAVPNGNDGIQLTGSGTIAGVGTGNEIGVDFGNVIGANRTPLATTSAAGINLGGGAYGNVVANNVIGTDRSLTVDLGHDGHGILIDPGAHTNTISANTIRFNDGDGIRNAGVANLFTENGIFDQGGLGIDNLGGEPLGTKVTPNDALDADGGSNLLQNFPEVATAIDGRTTGASHTIVRGTLHTEANVDAVIEVFSSTSADPSGYGEGAVFGAAAVVSTDGTGDASFEIIDPNAVAGDVVTTTASVGMNTSEFSGALLVVGNVPPTAADDADTTAEETPVVVDVLANDSDPDDGIDASTVSIIDPPVGGSADSNGDGTITYTPDSGTTGDDSFVYEVCDHLLGCDRAEVTVSVEVIPDPPVANDDGDTTADDTPVVIDVAANDVDPDGDLDPTSAAPTSSPAHGTAVGNADGTITYTPDGTFVGTDTFDYEICDTTGLCATATVSVEVTASNTPPIANDDEATVDEDGSVSIPVTDNDVDDDGNLDETTLSIVSPPSNGSAVVVDGSVTYEPTSGFVGTDTFTYEVCDTHGECDDATVTVIVDEVVENAPPVADPGGPYVVAVDGVVDFDGTNSSDPDGDALTFAWSVDGGGAVADGTVAQPEFTAGSDPGVYTVTLTVTDPSGASDTSETMVVLFDPDAGFVTGGGWIDSPEGALTTDAAVSGRASFGFVSKYKKGATHPSGNTEFQFRSGDLNFHSTSYEWLVVTGPHARFLGTGTINGEGVYRFMVTVTDGNLDGSDVDRFRIRIWTEDAAGTESVVYDNQPGDDSDSDATTAITHGSIVIHAPKGKG